MQQLLGSRSSEHGKGDIFHVHLAQGTLEDVRKLCGLMRLQAMLANFMKFTRYLLVYLFIIMVPPILLTLMWMST